MKKEHFSTAAEETTVKLGEEELTRVAAGMKYDPNYTSADVIDARGGSFRILGFTVTLDVNGNVSSVSR